MASLPADAREFYTERVPAHWNRTLDDELARDEARAARMQQVDATIRVVAEGPAGGVFHLNVARGRMAAADTATHAPFMTLIHDAASFAVVERAAGDSILGFLGAVAGRPDSIKLTPRMVENLVALAGGLRFELTGDEGFTLTGLFGRGQDTPTPGCTLRLDPTTFAALRSGALSAENAFLGGQVEVEGDLQLAIALAFAAMAPD